MTLINGDKFLSYLIFSKHIDSLTCGEVKEAVEMCKVDVLDKIKEEIQKEENIWYHDCEPDFSKDFDVIRVDTVLSIIDKYRESEEA